MRNVKAILKDKNGKQITILEVSDLVGTLIRQDPRLNPPVRAFRFHGIERMDAAGGALTGVFQEVEIQWIDSLPDDVATSPAVAAQMPLCPECASSDHVKLGEASFTCTKCRTYFCAP